MISSNGMQGHVLPIPDRPRNGPAMYDAAHELHDVQRRWLIGSVRIALARQ